MIIVPLTIQQLHNAVIRSCLNNAFVYCHLLDVPDAKLRTSKNVISPCEILFGLRKANVKDGDTRSEEMPQSSGLERRQLRRLGKTRKARKPTHSLF